MNQVLVVQTWGIGDMIMTTPMLGALRRVAPATRITVMARSRVAADVVDGSSLCDRVLVLSPRGEPGPMGFGQLAMALFRLRPERFDLAIVATRISSRVGQLLRVVSGVGRIAGDSAPPRPSGYTYWCQVEPSLHRVLSNMRILQTVFPAAQPGPLVFALDDASGAEAKRFAAARGLTGRPLLAIHPGSDPLDPQKRIPPAVIRSVARAFLERFPDARIILLIGPDERDLQQEFQEVDARVCAVTGLSLRGVARLIGRSSAVLTGDTGIGHIGAALGVPVVTLAGPTETRSTHPWSAQNVVLRTPERLGCMPCYGTPLYGQCPINFRCMKGIPPTLVVEALAVYFRDQDLVRPGLGSRRSS